MKPHLLLHRVAAALCAAMVMSTGAGGAQIVAGEFPSRPLTLVVPYPAGGSNDNAARQLAKKLSEALGQPVVVDNRSGASGTLGAEHVARAAPDGYTLLYASSSFLTAPVLQARPVYDPLKSFVPVARVSRAQFVIAIGKQVPTNTLQDLIAQARSHPRKLSYGSSGVGSINHFATEAFAETAGIRLTHVPYRGMTPAMQDLAGGHVDIVLGSVPSTMAQVKNGRVRALAVTGESAAPQLPGLPTAASAGAPGFTFDAWSGVLAPAGTPQAVIDRLETEVARALKDPALRAAFEAEGASLAPTGSAEFSRILATELRRFRQLAQKADIRAE